MTIAIDRAACDDRLRVIAFALENANHQGAYYNGLAAFMGATCRASDDISRPLGDPAEASTRAALDFLAGRSCTAISASAAASGTGLSPQSAGAQLSKPMELVNGADGKPLDPVLIDAESGRRLELTNVRAVAGPGADQNTRTFFERLAINRPAR